MNLNNSPTQLINMAASGDHVAMGQLIEIIYPELKKISAGIRRKQFKATQTYNTTALVNEAWLKINQAGMKSENKKHFFCTMAKAMKQVLINHSTQKQAQKNDGIHLTLDGSHAITEKEHEWLLRMEEVLKAIERKNSRIADVFQMKYFLAMTDAEVSEALNTSLKTTQRDWHTAKSIVAKFLKT